MKSSSNLVNDLTELHEICLDVLAATSQTIYYQLSPKQLIAQSLERGEGVLNDTGALVIETGEFTGRSPKDRYIVKDASTAGTIHWNEFNQPIEEKYFDRLYRKVINYLADKELWIRDCCVSAEQKFRLTIRVINENPCCNLFAYNMFLRSNEKELASIHADWHLVQVPHFFADPDTDGIPRKNFVLINFAKKIILIGGTQYTGEIKKAVFSILNYLLPLQSNVLTMHCAANIGNQDDTAIFFGLSGTGKTTLSTDAGRRLIGDDEHAWDKHSIFNLEGGCYAKIINLDKEKEPCIFNAIRSGAIIENADFAKDTNIIDFRSAKLTENTRVSYPIDYIENAAIPGIGKTPRHIFFLTADAFGVLPPISRLTRAQAMYYFISGYTAKVAGTENGISEPKPTFSACFAAPFIPLHPVVYADMLHDKLKESHAQVWLINTGWYGGKYGEGKRIPLEYTRAMIKAALTGKLAGIRYITQAVFHLSMPVECAGVPAELLNPQAAWQDKDEWLKTAYTLARYFSNNFHKYAENTEKEILQAAPEIHI
jgi:phosphoenolpyruvate carboxykinase (ATP)